MSALIALGLLVASCSPIIDNRGHSTQDVDFKQVIVGQSREEDVQAVLGSPSVLSDFGPQTWYYISEEQKTVGMFAPKVSDQHVVAIRFDENHVVDDIGTYVKEDGKPVQVVSKTTPSEGHELTFMEQMMGNFGRFAAPGHQINPRDYQR